MKQISWIGHYVDINEKGVEEECPFRIDATIDHENAFKGKVWEEKFYGLTGEFADVKGFLENEVISFVLTYPFQFDYDENLNTIIDRNRPGHDVTYEGHWDENSKSWKGEWEIELEVEQLTFEYDKVTNMVNNFEMTQHLE